jgi:radical SAM protein with 4Fe4S-binding SPASM domain
MAMSGLLEKATDGDGGLRRSRYLRTRARKDRTVIFHELHPDPVYVPTELWGRFETGHALPGLLQDQLIDRGLLVPSSEADDDAYASAHTDLLRRLDSATLLYLVLVQDCNFACSYCPIPDLSRQHGARRMSASVATKAVDLWARHIADDDADLEYCAILYGGEPLLNLPALTAAVRHIEELQARGALPDRSRLSIMVCSNGVLIDERFAEYCREHELSVTVGCDGPSELHDEIRRSTDGQETFDEVVRGIRQLVDVGVPTFASASITPHNVSRLGELPRFFRELGVAKYGLNFLRGRLLFRLVDRDRLNDYYESATAGVLANLGSANESYEHQLDRKLMSYLERSYFPTDCNGYGNQLVIDPVGRIGNCPFLEGGQASVEAVEPNFRIHQNDQARQWRNRLPLYNSNCQPCDAKSICGGGCAWNALELKGDPLAIDDAMCMLTRKLFDLLIWSQDEADPGGSQ